MDVWPVEDMLDGASLFYRVPVSWLRIDMKPHVGVFRENKGSISTDWDKYGTAATTRERQGRPERFAVIRLSVGGVREIRELVVSHSPTQNVPGLPDNRAHTDIFGLELPADAKPELGRKERIRTELYKRFNTWEIEPGAPVGTL
ncbi:MAG: hypothetical protein ABSD59_09195 [Terracidiphilus sp.]|jgi:hypothetical protein